MSKHWNPRAGYRRSTYSRRSRRKGGELWQMVVVGVCLGLAYAFVPLGGPTLPNPSRGGDGGGVEVASPSIVSIIDGDTFRYGGEKIRIADIDTPEIKGRCDYETELAARATQRMDALLHEGPFELHPVERDEDRHGRKLRIVTRGGRSLGDQLVSEGLARTWTGRRQPWCGTEA